MLVLYLLGSKEVRVLTFLSINFEDNKIQSKFMYSLTDVAKHGKERKREREKKRESRRRISKVQREKERPRKS